MKVYRLCTKKNRGENRKPSWPEIGVVFLNDQGQMSGYLNNAPDVQIYLFEQKPREQQAAPQGPAPAPPASEPDPSFDPTAPY